MGTWPRPLLGEVKKRVVQAEIRAVLGKSASELRKRFDEPGAAALWPGSEGQLFRVHGSPW